MTLLIKNPPASKSNPIGIKGNNMRIFFMQKLSKKVFEQAIKTNHIFILQ